jgi:hypothetical protein
MMKRTFSTLLLATIAMGGCANKNFLDTQYAPYRADLSDQPIEVTHNPPAVAPIDVFNPDPTQTPTAPSPPLVQEIITGTWTFTTPSTVTRNERKNAQLSEFSLYNGRPRPSDKPFVVITVAPADSDGGSHAEADPEKFHTSATRQYVLNGNLAKEWSGLTTDGAAFCELIVRRPGEAGDVCHAVAIAKNTAERKLALDILGSITWQAVP